MLDCCNHCAKFYGCDMADRWETGCLNYEPETDPHTQTNADRIRAMTDEELARFINFHTFCEDCPAYGLCPEPFALDGDECTKTIAGWLGQEATE